MTDHGEALQLLAQIVPHELWFQSLYTVLSHTIARQQLQHQLCMAISDTYSVHSFMYSESCKPAVCQNFHCPRSVCGHLVMLPTMHAEFINHLQEPCTLRPDVSPALTPQVLTNLTVECNSVTMTRWEVLQTVPSWPQAACLQHWSQTMPYTHSHRSFSNTSYASSAWCYVPPSTSACKSILTHTCAALHQQLRAHCSRLTRLLTSGLLHHRRLCKRIAGLRLRPGQSHCRGSPSLTVHADGLRRGRPSPQQTIGCSSSLALPPMSLTCHEHKRANGSKLGGRVIQPHPGETFLRR